MSNSEKNRKNLILILIAAVLAVLLAYFYPSNNHGIVAAQVMDEYSLVPQNITGVSSEYYEVTKLYYKNQLIGVLRDEKTLDNAKERAFERYYKTSFSDMDISLNGNIYVYKEKTNLEYENIDDKIEDYLVDNDMYLVDAYKINIGDEEVVYVKSVEDFKSALKDFVLNFIDEKVYLKLENNEDIVTLSAYGEQDVNVYIEEKMVCREAKINAEGILTSRQAILMYLSYGRDYELNYYTVQEFDTIPGVANKTGIPADMIVLINENITSADMAIKPGTLINITPFNSPLHVVVERERFVDEVVNPPATQYVQDDDLVAGTSFVAQQGVNGSRDTLYREIYINGTLTSYMQVSTKVTKEPVQKIVHIGAGVPFSAQGDFRWPVNNGYIMCNYTCYKGHHGVDFADRYNKYGKIYACGDGVIIQAGWSDSMGWYYIINHGDGIVLRYMHMKYRGPLAVGTNVTKGQHIGTIGMTGWATAPHVHISVYINGVMIDPCILLGC